MKVALVTTCWKRPHIAEIFFRYYAAFEPVGVEIIPFAGISPEDPCAGRLTTKALDSGFEVVSASNTHLARKWNSVMSAARESDPDFVLTIDSDDLINESLLQAMAMELQYSHFAEPSSFFLYYTPSGTLIYRRLRQMGTRLFDASLLGQLGWNLWDDSSPRAMAMNAAQDRRIDGVLRKGKVPHKISDVVMGIKDNQENRIHFKSYYRNQPGDTIEAVPFLRTHFPSVHEQILSL